MLELYYNFSTRICDVSYYEALETDTESLYLTVAENKLEDCIRPEMKAEWERLQSKDWIGCFTTDAVGKLFHRMCCDKLKNT